MNTEDRDRELIEDFKEALLNRDWSQMADVIYITECRISEDDEDGE